MLVLYKDPGKKIKPACCLASHIIWVARFRLTDQETMPLWLVLVAAAWMPLKRKRININQVQEKGTGDNADHC